MADLKHSVCPGCSFVYLHVEGEGCPRCERNHLRELLHKAITTEITWPDGAMSNVATELEDGLRAECEEATRTEKETHKQRWARLGYEVAWNELHRKYEVKWTEDTKSAVRDPKFCSKLLSTIAEVDAWITTH
jgi:hypothetical protein